MTFFGMEREEDAQGHPGHGDGVTIRAIDAVRVWRNVSRRGAAPVVQKHASKSMRQNASVLRWYKWSRGASTLASRRFEAMKRGLGRRNGYPR